MSQVNPVEFFRPPTFPTGGTVYLRPSDSDNPDDVSSPTAPDLLAQAAESNVAHNPCCSSHGVPMTCEYYRRTHFVEVRPCCSEDARRLAVEVSS